MRILACTVTGCLMAGLSIATLAAPQQRGQPGADRPGIVMQPRVNVENRGKNEAIPVSIQEWGLDRVIGVQVAGTVQTSETPQTWMYRTVRIAAGTDMAGALQTSGNQGWEATGVQMPDGSGGINVLMKQPRQAQ